MGTAVNNPTSASFAFGDKRIFLCHAGQASAICGVYVDEPGIQSVQWFDSPQYIVVGKNAPDDKCRRLAKRFGPKEEELMAFRDGACEIPMPVEERT